MNIDGQSTFIPDLGRSQETQSSIVDMQGNDAFISELGNSLSQLTALLESLLEALGLVRGGDESRGPGFPSWGGDNQENRYPYIRDISGQKPPIATSHAVGEEDGSWRSPPVSNERDQKALPPQEPIFTTMAVGEEDGSWPEAPVEMVPAPEMPDQDPRVPGEYLVSVRPGADANAVRAIFAELGIQDFRQVTTLVPVYLVKLEHDPGPAAMQHMVAGSNDIMSVDPNWIATGDV